MVTAKTVGLVLLALALAIASVSGKTTRGQQAALLFVAGVLEIAGLVAWNAGQAF